MGRKRPGYRSACHPRLAYPDWLNTRLYNHHLDWQEWVGALAGLVIGTTLLVFAWWLYPRFNCLKRASGLAQNGSVGS